MSKGKLYLVRHGESMGNVWPGAYVDDNRNFLSPYGVMQAQLVGHYFKRMGITFDTVVSSDLTRARHTTACILHEMDWQRSWNNDAAFNELPNTVSQYDQRKQLAIARFKGVLEQWNEGNMLLVSHYHTMQVLFSHLVSIPRNIASHEGKHVGNAQPFVWDPAVSHKIDLLALDRLGDQH